MKNTTKQKESQARLFELFSVEELESRLEFKKKGRRNSRGVSSVRSGVPCFETFAVLSDIFFGG